MLAHAWSGAFSSTRIAIPMLLMPALLRLHRNRKHILAPLVPHGWMHGFSHGTEKQRIYKLALDNW